MQKLLDLIFDTNPLENWTKKSKEAFEELFGSPNGRYGDKAKKKIQFRCPNPDIPYAAMIDISNPTSGPYGGMSFVIFPVEDGPCLISMGIGTQGLNPDELILGSPGHSRKVSAISDWLNKEYSNGQQLAWSKMDPVRTDIDIPKTIKKLFNGYSKVFSKYGTVLYGLIRPVNNDKNITEIALKTYLDLFFEEKGEFPLAKWRKESDKIKSEYLSVLLKNYTKKDILNILSERRFIILQGPPGTGKTRMALKLIKEEYNNNGKTIQFHPNTSYEDFIGGLSPQVKDTDMGFSFAPKKGHLLNAIIQAGESSEPYLLHIDEINRADLAKVLGEAIFLFEPDSLSNREIELNYDFGEKIGKSITIPENLHVLGTMNSSDRSIAILDIAIRRRFSFVNMWPQMKIVQVEGCKLMQTAFSELLNIFIEHAPKEVFNLLPGHSYFLSKEENQAKTILNLNLVPLLEEYIWQGYVASFADSIQSYIQWIKSL